MSDFLIHMEQEQTETPVSNIFLDEYMPEANGAYVKIYLYLLMGQEGGNARDNLCKRAIHKKIHMLMSGKMCINMWIMWITIVKSDFHRYLPRLRRP